MESPEKNTKNTYWKWIWRKSADGWKRNEDVSGNQQQKTRQVYGAIDETRRDLYCPKIVRTKVRTRFRWNLRMWEVVVHYSGNIRSTRDSSKLEALNLYVEGRSWAQWPSDLGEYYRVIQRRDNPVVPQLSADYADPSTPVYYHEQQSTTPLACNFLWLTWKHSILEQWHAFE